jgi:tetratricopeptide (TPR) repeat protein
MARNNRAREPERAAQQLAEGLSLYESLPAPGIEISVECLRSKSLAQRGAGDTEAALDTLRATNALLEAHPAPGTDLRGLVFNDIALIHFQSGRQSQAIEYLDHVLELLEAAGRGATLGYQTVAGNRAVVLNNLGRTPDALDAFADLVERMRASGFQGRGAAGLLAQYGDLLMTVGRTDQAEAIYAEGLAVAEAAGNRRTGAFLNIGLAKVHLANNAFEKAFERLDAAQVQVEANERADPTLARNIRVMRVKLYRNTGDLAMAAREVDALLADTGYPEARETPGMISALIEGAEVYRQLSDYATARQLVDGLIDRLQDHGRSGSEGDVHLGRALVQRAELLLESGAPAAAVADLESALPHLVYALGEDHGDVEQARSLLAQARGAESN